MAEIQVTAKKKIGDEDKEAVIAFDFGENIEDASAKFGADVVFTNFRASAKITAQAAMRRYLEAGLSADQVAEKMKAWKPGVALERAAVDPVKAILAKWGTMSKEEKTKLLSDLRET